MALCATIFSTASWYDKFIPALLSSLLMLALLVQPFSPTRAGEAANDAQIKQGRYIAQIAGCNDCHTPGYASSGGNVPEQLWLIGDELGWRGPWGTTYASNLRLVFSRLSEEQWLQIARTSQFRPPMPWFALRDMSESDLRALYHFVRLLGPAGKPAPAYLPPGQKPADPYVQFPADPPPP